MGEIVQVANVIVPVVLCILVGFGLAKAKAPFDGKMVGSLVTNVGYPALILSNLESAAVSFETFIIAMLATAIVTACFAAIGLMFLLIMGLSPRAFLSPMMFNNAGNVGLPICTLASLKTRNLWRGTCLALFHLIMAIGVAFGITEIFGFEGDERGAMILLCMMPVAIATYLWIETYRPADAPHVAGFILVSTLLAVVSLPLALVLWV